MTTDAYAPDRFDIVRVIQETLAVLRRNLFTFFILGFLLCGIPAAITGWFQFGVLRDVAEGARSGVYDFSFGRMTIGGLGGLVTLVTTAILQGALIYATVQDLNGTPASIPDSLAMGLRNFLSLIIVTIGLALAVACGMILLVVPGVMIACAWCVAAPALVADRTGIGGAFRRAADLTRGHRWQIFGLAVLVVVVLWIIDAIVDAATGLGAIGMSGGDPLAVLEKVFTPVTLVAIIVRQTITTVIGATAIAVLYVELRRAREGAGPEWLRDVFS